MSHTGSEDLQLLYIVCFLYETIQAPCLQQSHIPPAQARGGEGGGQATSNPLGHTHSITTKCLLPRFRKVVALSTIPNGKENEWKRKLKKKWMTWMQLKNIRWMERRENIKRNSQKMAMVVSITVNSRKISEYRQNVSLFMKYKRLVDLLLLFF